MYICKIYICEIYTYILTLFHTIPTLNDPGKEAF